MCGSSISPTEKDNEDDDDDDYDIDGIVMGHAYSILGVYEVLIEGETKKLVKFRNPQ